ncbi:hypothetical protein [Actinoallomurus rhizosphaericola]|uniref:hypothetical protein n=1 Tax=Actinoallomurus rhizosphaericola TaxID=2952536 RepID=UPI002092F5B5|nr:hypothetical protein [Actinoallomurus rhizosphaericola]MCO5995674.1 hypothetical protein [Actinoallomurus rhizosphaericola]
MRRPLTIAVILLAATACSSTDEPGGTATPSVASRAPAVTTSSIPPARTAKEYAAALKAAMPRVKRMLVVTETSDSNNLLGRPNGYTSAAVLSDKVATQCQSARDGIDCGAVVEVWPDAQAVAQRVSYIQGILKKAPALGSEWDYPAGTALLRVNGKVVRPSVAKTYEAAWRRVAG